MSWPEAFTVSVLCVAMACMVIFSQPDAPSSRTTWRLPRIQPKPQRLEWFYKRTTTTTKVNAPESKWSVDPLITPPPRAVEPPPFDGEA